MKRFLLAAVAAAFGGHLVARPGAPIHPQGEGREGTPVEREFHLPLPAEKPLPPTPSQRPKQINENDVWDVVNVVLPWTKAL